MAVEHMLRQKVLTALKVVASEDDIKDLLILINTDLEKKYLSSDYDDIWEDDREFYEESGESREDWAKDRMSLDIEEGHPAAYFMKPERLKPGVWLVHFTDADPMKIVKSGFHGRDIETLGLTSVFKEGTRTGPFALAYQAISVSSPRWGDFFGAYGKNAVLFKAKNAIWAYHDTDEEYQVIFTVDSVSEMHPIYGDDDSLELRGQDREPLFECQRDQHCINDLIDILEGKEVIET